MEPRRSALCCTAPLGSRSEEERVVAAPVRPDLHVVDVDVRALVGVLEPQVGWLFLSERDGGFERERALGVVRRVPVDSVDGIGRGDGVAAVSPCREILVRPLERSLVYVHAGLGHCRARVALIGGIRLDDGIRDDGNGLRVQGEIARLPKPVVDFGTFRGTSQFNHIAVKRHFGRQQQNVLAHDPSRRYAARACRPGRCVGGLDERAVASHVLNPVRPAIGGVEPVCGKACDFIQESASLKHVSIALFNQRGGVEDRSLRDGALLEHVPGSSGALVSVVHQLNRAR